MLLFMIQVVFKIDLQTLSTNDKLLNCRTPPCFASEKGIDLVVKNISKAN